MRILRNSILMIGLLSLVAPLTFADVIGGVDFDGGSTNGGFVPLTQTLTPDNTADNGAWPGGSFFDRFGIATIDTAGDGVADGVDLPFDVVDQSLMGFPGDRNGVIPESKTDNVFVIVDLENGNNLTSPMATASWDFDISNHNNLSLSIDFGAIGDFGADGGGRNDSFRFSYSIDGGTSQTLMNITSTNDDRAYVVNMLDGGQFITGDANFFFDELEFNALGCTTGLANSCASGDVDFFGDGSVLIRTDAMDTNNDGVIYADIANSQFTDTPVNPGDLDEGAIRTYGETNGFGTFDNPEFELYKNPLWINGDENRIIENQISTFAEAVAGTGSTLTLTLEAEQYGGDQFLVFDNIVVEGTPIGGGGVDGDFNDDGVYDCDDIDALVGDIAGANNTAGFDLTGDGAVDGADLDAWLAEAGEVNIGPGRSYLDGDANLDGVVDTSDFNIWNGSNFTATAEWCSGDFNADGFVDTSDFNIWNGNNFTSSDVSAVPEPGSFLLLLMGVCTFSGMRRNRSRKA